jgi:hypothetical protein
MTCLFPVSQYSCVRPIGTSPKALVPLMSTKTASFNSFNSARSLKVLSGVDTLWGALFFSSSNSRRSMWPMRVVHSSCNWTLFRRLVLSFPFLTLSRVSSSGSAALTELQAIVGVWTFPRATLLTQSHTLHLHSHLHSFYM